MTKTSHDYRHVLRQFIHEKKATWTSLTDQEIAKNCGIQKSYFSRVLSGHADLSADQIFKIADYLGLKPVELKYVQLLLEYARSSVPKRREKLQREIDHVRLKLLDPSSVLNAKKPRNQEADL